MRLAAQLLVCLLALCLFPIVSTAQSREHAGPSAPESTELQNADRLITEAYREVLGRNPDGEGLEFFRGKLLEEEKDEGWLREALAASPEAAQKREQRVRKRRNALLFWGLAAVLAAISFLCSWRSEDAPGGCAWGGISPAVLSKLLGGFFLFYFGAFLFWRYSTFQLGLDWMKIASSLYHSSRGDFLKSYIDFGGYSLWKEHFSPIVLLSLPVYKLWPKAASIVLLFSQVLAVWGAGVLLYRISRDTFSSDWCGLLAQGFFYSRPEVQRAVLHDFHMLTLAPFFILLAYRGALKRNDLMLWGGFLACLMVREDVFFAAAGVPLLMMLTQRRIKVPLMLCVTIVLYEVMVFTFAFPALRGEQSYAFTGHYGWLAGSFGELAWRVLTEPLAVAKSILFERDNRGLVTFLGRFFWLPLMSPAGWASGAPVMAESMLSNVHQLTSYSYHYVMPPVASLMVGTVCTLKFWSDVFKSRIGYRYLPQVILCLLVAYNCTHSIDQGTQPFSRYSRKADVRFEREKFEHMLEVSDLASKIPKGAVWGTSANLYGKLYATPHSRVYQGRRSIKGNWDFLLLDSNNFIRLYEFDTGWSVVQELIVIQGWLVRDRRGSLILLQRERKERRK